MARTAAFMPGASPPLVNTPIRFTWLPMFKGPPFMRYAIGMLRNQILAFIFRPPAGKAPPKVRLIMSLGKKIVKRKAMGPKAFQPLAGPWRKFFQKLLDFLLTNGPGFSILTKPSQERGASREHSSAGRAHALQAWGHRFEPCCSHQNKKDTL